MFSATGAKVRSRGVVAGFRITGCAAGTVKLCREDENTGEAVEHGNLGLLTKLWGKPCREKGRTWSEKYPSGDTAAGRGGRETARLGKGLFQKKRLARTAAVGAGRKGGLGNVQERPGENDQI